MNRLTVVLLAALPALAGDPAARVTRAMLAPMERAFDTKMGRSDEPFDLIGPTRSVYLEGYGVVFTAEVNMLTGPGITPFRPTISKEEVVKLHAKKLARLPKLKELIQEMLVGSAASLDTLPRNEQVVVSVALFNLHWEDTSGLPGQIVMQAPRGALLDAKTNAPIQVRVY